MRFKLEIVHVFSISARNALFRKTRTLRTLSNAFIRCKTMFILPTFDSGIHIFSTGCLLWLGHYGTRLSKK